MRRSIVNLTVISPDARQVLAYESPTAIFARAANFPPGDASR